MIEWKEVTVDQIKADSPNALATGPFGSAISSKFFTDKGISVIRGGNLSVDVFNRLSETGFVFISINKAEEFKRSEVRKGDLIFTCWGTINQIGLIDGRSSYPVYIISNKQMKLTPHPNKTDSEFLYYFFSSPRMQEQILSSNIGSSVPGFNLGQLKAIELNLPPLPEQKAIASVLSCLDDKIDLLHCQNKTLEAMAETLFRQWFVEEAQEDWEEVTLGECCRVITKGTTPTTLKKRFVLSGINFIKVNCIDGNGNFLIDKFQFIDKETNVLLSRSKLEEGDILYSIAGTIGRLIIVGKKILPANVNQALAIIRVNSEKINPVFIKYCLKDREITENLHSKVVHAVQPNLSLGEISKTTVPFPPKEVMENFVGMVEPMESKLQRNKSQIRTLETLRDTLLPKLMSSEVKVKI